MKIEVGKKYRISGSDKPWEVVAIDGNGVAWGLVDGVMRHLFVSVMSEWHDKPDPGEDWRLLHPDEDVEEGDQFLNGNRWEKSINFRRHKKQGVGFAYRRRIAPQYVPYTWDDREELRGRWYRQKDYPEHERLVAHLEMSSNEIEVNGWGAEKFLQKCEWLDGSPCGRKVV